MTIQTKIKKARGDIIRILKRYNITLPEVMGIFPIKEDKDEKIWKKIEPTYRRVQKKVFKEMYPNLASKKKDRK